MKPLTKDEREAAMTYSDRTDADWVPESIIKDLLSAEAFWREAVKNCDSHRPGTSESDNKFGDGTCVFCDGQYSIELKSSDHKPGCPWLLAQE